MGLYDRDYMRERQGWRDRYHSWLEDSTAPSRRRSNGGWTWRRTMVFTFLVVFGLLVLPQFTIAGRHWHLFWL